MDNENSGYVLALKALSDETRFRIMGMLSKGELCACTILEYFHFTQPTLSYHMKLLCDSGLVLGRRDGAWMRYSINRQRIEEIKSVLDNFGSGDGAACDDDCCK